MPVDAAILEEFKHLKQLHPKEKAALADKMELLRFGPGEAVFNFGDPGDALFIVRRGEVEIFVENDQGEKIVLEVSRPGAVFGEISLLDNGPRTAWVTALSDAEVLRLDRQHFEEYVRQYPPAALNLLSVVAGRLRKSDDVIRHTVTRNANDVTAQQETLWTRLADAVPAITGSVGSLAIHALFLGSWIVLNLTVAAFDRFPFQFLSVIISLEAIFLTLFVLTSQNRQRARDQIRSDIEFESAMNAELKIAYLHEKLDRLAESHYEALENTKKLLGEGKK